MYTFLCKLLYVGDRSSHSANIPDQVGHLCIIKSDIRLNEIPRYKIVAHYEINELLHEYDCESITLEELSDEDIKEYSDVKDILVINENDI